MLQWTQVALCWEGIAWTKQTSYQQSLRCEQTDLAEARIDGFDLWAPPPLTAPTHALLKNLALQASLLAAHKPLLVHWFTTA